MEVEHHSLGEPPGRLLDLDVDEWNDWVGVVTIGRETWVWSPGGRFIAEKACRSPLVRLVSQGRVLLVDRREGRRDTPNAWIYERDGTSVAKWYAGDHILDVVCFEEYVAFTYIDQAFGDSRGLDGVTLFRTSGSPIAHYNQFGSYAIVDCYCACRSGSRSLAFLGYPGFPLVELDIEELTEKCWQVPGRVSGSSAVVSWRGDFIFHGSYSDKCAFVAWTPGDDEGIECGNFAGYLRGLRDGHFLCVEPDGYSIISFETESS